jgi:sigma-B regulation protein RsbU (phosphoserine phosphatase)
VLSILEDFPYEEETVPVSVGDVIVMYSDGITEAVNPQQEQFGEERIVTVVAAHRTEPAAGIIDSIVSAVRQHAGVAPQGDDMTVLVIKRV